MVVKAFGRAEKRQVLWLVAKVKIQLYFVFEGGVLCVKN
jgi:hypothetical protein